MTAQLRFDYILVTQYIILYRFSTACQVLHQKSMKNDYNRLKKKIIVTKFSFIKLLSLTVDYFNACVIVL